MTMTNEQAYTYAAQWGSFVTNGDPGACMYGFSQDFTVQSESHRADCIAWMEQSRKEVTAAPSNYEADELDLIDSLLAKLRATYVTGATPFDALDSFCQEYARTVLFQGVEIGSDEQAYDLDPANLSAEACEGIKADCDDFRAKYADLIAAAEATGYDQVAYDFQLTRCGAGVGFWDRSELEDGGLGDKLSDAAKSYGDQYAYQGDDGFIYIG